MKLESPEFLVQPEGELWKRIRVELNEDRSANGRDLALVKDWLRKQPHLPDDWDDQPILTFLRGCCFSMEKTKSKLDMYFTMRAACPEFFSDRDATSPALSNLLANKIQGPTLPGLTPEGRRVTIYRGVDPSLDSAQTLQCLKLALMVGDVRLHEEREGVAGDVAVLDARVLGAAVLAKLSPLVMRKFLMCVQEAYPVKLKEIHVINTSALVERFINLIKPILKEKIRNRIFFHRDLQSLYSYVPRAMLPREYGGDCGTMDELHAKWTQKLKDYRDWFLAQESIKADEALRSKPKNYDEIFGVEGSFRKLVID